MSERSISIQKEWDWKKFFFQWEWLLVALFLVIVSINSSISPYFLSLDTFISVPMSFLDKSFIVLSMMLVIMTGNIDISVGSIVALSSVLMGVSFNAGLPMPMAILLCISVATLCGLINGLMIAYFKELSAMIITLSTMIIYRGIAYIILEDQASGKFPTWFSFFGWNTVAGIPFVSICFFVCVAIYAVALHKTTFGRKIYGIGNNKLSCLYSGISVDKIMVIIYTLNGLMSGFTAIFLTSRMGSTRPNVASGYELEVIAMVVLGGVSTSGGKGKIIGPILAIFIIGFLNYGLGLVNAQAQTTMIIVGLLLVFSVVIQNVGLNRAKKSTKK